MNVKHLIIEKILNKLPYIRGLKRQIEGFQRNTFVPNGHFYSPVVDQEYVRENEARIWKDISSPTLQGIDLNVEEQLALLAEFEGYYQDIPFGETPKEGSRYYFQNSYYSYTDAITLYNFIRKYRPSRIIEVGSGFSSAAMLDSIDQLGLDTKLIFIEPYPDRLYQLLSSADKARNEILEKSVQDVAFDNFEALQAGDFLFIDSSHVVKTGSDLQFLIFEVLPKLKKGVLIHFHDVFYPFEYPKDWISEGRSWNEDYFLRAFLMYNTSFKVKSFSHYLSLFHQGRFEKMPLYRKNWGGNLWLEVQ
jgi:predicted O-methyltransferase YrrM